MFSHVMLGVNDLERSKRFYDAVLGTLGIKPGFANGSRYFYRSPLTARRPATAGAFLSFCGCVFQAALQWRLQIAQNLLCSTQRMRLSATWHWYWAFHCRRCRAQQWGCLPSHLRWVRAGMVPAHGFLF